MNKEKLKTMLGFAQKAGKLVSGEDGVTSALKSKKVNLILVATDASDDTKKKYSAQAQNYNIAHKEVLTKEELGNCIGKNFRTAVAIIDDGFAKTIITLL